MRRFGKLLVLAAIVGTLGVSMPFSAFAMTKTISSVIIYAGMDELDSGETLPSESSFSSDETTGDFVYTNSDKYDRGELEWVTSDTKEMTIGYEPKMKVTLCANEGYAFKGGYQSSNVSVKGGTYVSAVRDGSGFLKVTFKFKPIRGTYNSPNNAEWRNSGYGGAHWSKVDSSSDAYDVYLYRGNTVIKKVEGLKATSYNFYPYMTKAGSYSFKVRTVPYADSEKKYAKKSDWTESDEVYLPAEKVSDGSGQDSGAPGGDGQVGWIRDGNIWYYKYPDGTYQKNTWLKINGKWYLFDSNGAMLTGWQQRNNLWYYLSDQGDMVTGWILVNNKWYYLNPSTATGVEGAMITGWVPYNNKWYCTDTSGAMLEGWRQVDGSWYYFYPGEGSKAVNTAIDGFSVDGNGVWHK